MLTSMLGLELRKNEINYRTFTGTFFNITRYLRGEKNRIKPLAIITSHSRNEWEQEAVNALASGIYSTFSPEEMPALEFFSAENSAKRLYNEAIWHLRRHIKKYSAVITIGHLPSIGFYEAQRNWPEKLPQIFVGVDDPAGVGLVTADENPGEFITGVRMVLPESYAEQIAFLRQLRGDKLRVLLPYDGNRPEGLGDTMRQQGVLGTEVISQGGSLLEIPFFAHTDVQAALMRHMGPSNVLCINNDSPVIVHGYEMVNMANRHGVTVFSTSLTMVRRGAAIGCGGTGGIYGSFAAEKVYHLLVQGRTTCDLSITHVQESSEIRFNPDTMEKQNVRPPVEMNRMLHARSVYANE